MSYPAAAAHGTSGRSREGARIEILTRPYDRRYNRVAPVRERGLKYEHNE